MDIGIGELSQLTGVKIPTIRYYEQIGLLRERLRSKGNQRRYDHGAVHRLLFIRRARDLGFAVAEINDLLGLWRDKSRQSADVKRIAQAHIAQLHERIESLEQMAATLEILVDCCSGDERPDCPILADLAHPGAERDLPDRQPGGRTSLRRRP